MLRDARTLKRRHFNQEHSPPLSRCEWWGFGRVSVSMVTFTVALATHDSAPTSGAVHRTAASKSWSLR